MLIIYSTTPQSYLGTTSVYIPVQSVTPIGCPGPYDSSVLTCDITWEPANSAGCQATPESNPHPLCGVTLQGLTVAGLQQQGEWYSRTSATEVNLDDVEEKDGSVFKTTFKATTFPDHAIWDGYALPEAQVYVLNYL